MNILIRLFLTAFVVFSLSNLLPGIVVNNYVTALIVAITIAVLNLFIRPILIILTLPITVMTLGLFLFVINACIILLAGQLVTGFFVNGFFTAIVFSILLSVFKSLLFKFLKEKK